MHFSNLYCPFLDVKIPNFLDIQRDSFQTFLNKGLLEEFENGTKITNSNNTIELLFYPKKYKCLPPKWNPKQTILKRKTYACAVFIPVQLTNYKTNQIILKWFLLVNLPLMTKNGHFIINGSPKIIMNQIVRSPGVYFQKTIKPDKQIIYSADFIAQRGTWLRLEIDNKKNEIWAKLKKTPKLPFFIFLRCFGLSIPVLNHYFSLNSFLSNKSQLKFSELLQLEKANQKKRKQKNKTALTVFSSQNENFIDFYNKLYPKTRENLVDRKKISKQFLYKKFLNPRLYNLSRLGRARINQKLGLTIPLDHTILTAKDILFACFYLIECQQGLHHPTDIDDLKNRKIRPAGELIQNQFSIGLFRFEKTIREKLKLTEKMPFYSKKNKIKTSHYYSSSNRSPFQLLTNPKSGEQKNTNSDSKSIFLNLNMSLTNFLNSKTIQNSFHEFFGTNPLCQLLDQTNPLSEITHKRRLSSLGLGGINRETAGMVIRGIHPTHYGRICPIETPEGQNAGLVNSFTIYCQLNKNGFIETPFYKTYKGMILKNKRFLFSSDQEKQFRLAPGDITKNKLNFLPKNVLIPCRQLKEFTRVSRDEINFIAVSPIQMISIATSLIPFLEHDDGNRALMGSNMQRQAVPTLKSSLPIVGTGLESKIISDINHGFQIKIGGFVSYVDGKQIIIYSKRQSPFLSNVSYGFDKFNFKNTTKLVSSLKKTTKSGFSIHKSNQSFHQSLLQLLPSDLTMTTRDQPFALPVPLPSLSPYVTRPLALTVRGGTPEGWYPRPLSSPSPCLNRPLALTVRGGTPEGWYPRGVVPPGGRSARAKRQQQVLSNQHQPQEYQNKKKRVKRSIFKSSLSTVQLLKKGSNAKTSLTQIQQQNNLILKLVLWKKKFGITYLCKENHHSLKKQTNSFLLNSRQLFTIFHFAYTNSFFKNWGLLTCFSTTMISKRKSQGFKPFLTKKNLQHLNEFYNKIVLLNYIKFLLINKNQWDKTNGSKKRLNRNSWSNLCYYGYGTGFRSHQRIKTCFHNRESKELINRRHFKIKFKQNKNNVNFFFKSFLFLSLPLVFNFKTNKNLPILSSNKNAVKKSLNPFCSKFFKQLTITNTSKFLIPFTSSTLNKKNPKTNKNLSFYHSVFYQQKSFEFSVLDTNNQNDYHFINFDFDQNKREKTKTKLHCHVLKDKDKYSPILNPLLPVHYSLDSFYRSNQDTYLTHRPIIKEGQWVEKNDIIADNSGSKNGQLALGQNLLIAYMPWEGYNFEDAVLISENVQFKDFFTTLHIERYEIEVRDTAFGKEQITNQLPDLVQDISYLDQFGIIKLGSWVQEGDILVGKITPVGQKKLSAYEKLLYDIIGKRSPTVKDSSLRVPFGVHGRVIHIEILETEQDLEIPKKNNRSFRSEVTNKKSKIMQSNLNQKKLKKITSKPFQKRFVSKMSFGRKHTPKKFNSNQKNKKHSFVKSNNVTNSDLVQSVSNQKNLQPKIKKTISRNVLNRMSSLSFLFEQSTKRNARKKVNSNLFFTSPIALKEPPLPIKSKGVSVNKVLFATKKPLKVHIYIAEKRKIQIGDKIAGRHGNKGIISNVLPQQDMPYLPDGTPIDLILNPLGVPSRMNVGQIFECLLGLAGYYLGQNYKIQPFDEIYGCEASRSLVYSKLYEAKVKTGQNWLFNANFPGKVRLFDGRTGECFDQPVTVGYSYILKLVHLVDEKIHARSTGPYSLVTQQPLRGRSKQGGQRVGEMEVWALEGFGAAYILQELLTIKSDDIKGRNLVSKAILNNEPLKFGTPESFKVLLKELQALCLTISIYKFNKKGQPTQMNISNLF